eukprot:TRINITY_DN9583_c0_g1_i3.p1 TRINITY_DN9583_c0_g1~~TRINITY_DN9583_c0_g1_i3.p1  ORF type:complete len:549 (+),score=148.69 TRINITY_DN9583_c0_g1_i3:34-1647(+)
MAEDEEGSMEKQRSVEEEQEPKRETIEVDEGQGKSQHGEKKEENEESEQMEDDEGSSRKQQREEDEREETEGEMKVITRNVENEDDQQAFKSHEKFCQNESGEREQQDFSKEEGQDIEKLQWRKQEEQFEEMEGDKSEQDLKQTKHQEQEMKQDTAHEAEEKDEQEKKEEKGAEREVAESAENEEKQKLKKDEKSVEIVEASVLRTRLKQAEDVALALIAICSESNVTIQEHMLQVVGLKEFCTAVGREDMILQLPQEGSKLLTEQQTLDTEKDCVFSGPNILGDDNCQDVTRDDNSSEYTSWCSDEQDLGMLFFDDADEEWWSQSEDEAVSAIGDVAGSDDDQHAQPTSQDPSYAHIARMEAEVVTEKVVPMIEGIVSKDLVEAEGLREEDLKCDATKTEIEAVEPSNETDVTALMTPPLRSRPSPRLPMSPGKNVKLMGSPERRHVSNLAGCQDGLTHDQILKRAAVAVKEAKAILHAAGLVPATKCRLRLKHAPGHRHKKRSEQGRRSVGGGQPHRVTNRHQPSVCDKKPQPAN